MNKELTVISRIILPSAEYADDTDLFVRHREEELLYRGKLQKVHVFRFNTWANILAAGTYQRYCAIDDLFLQVKTDCDCDVVLSNLKYTEGIFSPDETIRTQEIVKGKYYQIQVDSPQKLDNVFFTLVSKESDISIEAEWATSSEPAVNNKFAIITCTYKREKQVAGNIALFKQFIKDNPDLKERFGLFVVDNARTLPKTLGGEGVTIFPNPNTGGAGGFTRGIIEALKDKSYTRVLCMDDDVEVFPEAFFRTMALADFLRPEYQKSFIHGSMLYAGQKNIFWEGISSRKGYGIAPYHAVLDVSEPGNIAKANYVPEDFFDNDEKKAYSAWWYCSFPIQAVREKGLPLPLFVKWDDVEWSWRNFPVHHITVNGIFVWHDEFTWRLSKATRAYMHPRNSIFVNMLHSDRYQGAMRRMLKNKFYNHLGAMDYTSCEMFLKMMSDVLKGSRLLEENQEDILKELAGIAKQDVIAPATSMYAYTNVKDRYEEFMKDTIGYNRKTYRRRSRLYKYTLSGRLLPGFLWVRQRSTWLGVPVRRFPVRTMMPIQEFYFAKKVMVYNLGTNQVETREFSWKRRKELIREFKRLYTELDRSYYIIKSDLEKARDRFVTMEFWQEYLHLDK